MIIEIENLKKSFKDIKAVDDISFVVKEGELFAFLGVNGAGKSTTINIISGILICGAYMPISSFSEGLRNTLSLLPGTYGVGIMRHHYMNGYMQAFADEMRMQTVDEVTISNVINGMRDSFDANLYFFGNEMPLGAMYGILLGTCALLAVAFIGIVIIKNTKK